MVDVRDDIERFHHAGGDVVAVAMASPEQAAAFRERLKLPFSVLADADRRAYRAFGVPRGGVSQIAGPSIWLAGARALVRGGGGIPTADVRQMQAAFVIDSAGVVRFVHYGATSADNPTNDELIAVLQQLRQ